MPGQEPIMLSELPGGAPPATVANDPQNIWDRDEAHAFRKLVRQLRRAVADAIAQEADAKAKYKGARFRLKQADDALSTIEAGADDGQPLPDRWMYRLAEALAAAESAKEAERKARGEWVQAVFRQRQRQDERRVRERAHFQRYPLFDQLARTNGDGLAGKEPPASAPETNDHVGETLEETPTGEVPANLQGPAPAEPRWRSLSIAELELDKRVEKVLRAHGIVLLGELADRMDELGTSGMALKTIRKLRAALDQAATDDPPVTAWPSPATDQDAWMREVRDPAAPAAETSATQTSEAALCGAASPPDGVCNRPTGHAGGHSFHHPAPTEVASCGCPVPGGDDRLQGNCGCPCHAGQPQYVAEPRPRPYAWEMVYSRNDGTEPVKCVYVGSEKTARRKAMARPNAKEVLTCEPLTEKQFVAVYGRGKS